MRSLYALHPDTVLQLHERGAVVYGRPLVLTLAETEEALLQEDFSRIVVDQTLARSADARRALRRIESIHPQTKISWLRAGLRGQGDLALDDLARELRGEAEAPSPAFSAVVVSLEDTLGAASMALSIAAHLAAGQPTVLVETDTTEPVYARRLRVAPNLADYIGRGSVLSPRGWPQGLTLVAAPFCPALLLETGIVPLLERLESSRALGHVVARASSNLGDRGLIAVLAHASHVLIAARSPMGDADYPRWLRKLAPKAFVAQAAPQRLPLQPGRLLAAGQRLLARMEEAPDGD